jgi:hypothetical protein
MTFERGMVMVGMGSRLCWFEESIRPSLETSLLTDQGLTGTLLK